MRVEKRPSTPPPPDDVVITLNQREADLLSSILFSGIAFDTTVGGTANPIGRFARELKDELSSEGVYGKPLKSEHIDGFAGGKLVRLSEKGD